MTDLMNEKKIACVKVLNNLDFDEAVVIGSYIGSLTGRIEELEYASRHNGELNEFLQKRNLPSSTLGKHVVKVVMDYVEELEKQVEHHKNLLNKLQDDIW